jgi:D-tyrosyl-tRNA(Tyr) deacylase
MRVFIQRVSQASVVIRGKEKAAIQQGLLVFAGIEESDTMDDIEWVSGKICRLRIFSDANQLMNLSITDVKGSMLIISQFTLHASTKKGNRPSFIKAAKPEFAEPLYEALLTQLSHDSGLIIKCGEFGADMKIHLVNDGPVTIIMDSKNKE